jgi:hypothetical protein
VTTDGSIAAIDDGLVLYDYAFNNLRDIPPPQMPHTEAIRLYKRLKDTIAATEQIHTILEGKQTFHIFVPFVPRGEYVGSVYMKNTPDFSIIAKEMISNYDEISVTYAALIIFGLLAMFYISSYTLKERNETQQLLFEEQKRHLAEQIKYENELMFTKRIYHTHHKAEKIMGFIKEDMRNLSSENIDIVKHRINQYSNFIARVIYDMKWYERSAVPSSRPASTKLSGFWYRIFSCGYRPQRKNTNSFLNWMKNCRQCPSMSSSCGKCSNLLFRMLSIMQVSGG